MTLEDVVLAMGLVQRCANVMACAAAKNVVVILIKLQSIHLKDDERGSNTIFKKLQPKIRFRLCRTGAKTYMLAILICQNTMHAIYSRVLTFDSSHEVTAEEIHKLFVGLINVLVSFGFYLPINLRTMNEIKKLLKNIEKIKQVGHAI